VPVQGNSGTDWAAIISALSALLAFIFSFLQWFFSEKRSEARDKRDHFIDTVKIPITKHIDRLQDLQQDISRWAGDDTETDFSVLFERTVRYIQDLNREINHVEGGEFSDSWDWLAINTDDVVEAIDDVLWVSRQLHSRTFSSNLNRLVNTLDAAIAATNPRRDSGKKRAWVIRVW
tara:strand:- start:167 stop:694 length:528 start_codon:yes stop_codon:yes gene_type:complete